jgi:hypothetical protein
MSTPHTNICQVRQEGKIAATFRILSLISIMYEIQFLAHREHGRIHCKEQMVEIMSIYCENLIKYSIIVCVGVCVAK